ncbi:hypothetical protein IW262DRAFT_247970 [Armillaria fumosa]|nr:hypothetical protein IW262DRAFT_247970 [Armillaria fumosa]
MDERYWPWIASLTYSWTFIYPSTVGLPRYCCSYLGANVVFFFLTWVMLSWIFQFQIAEPRFRSIYVAVSSFYPFPSCA